MMDAIEQAREDRDAHAHELTDAVRAVEAALRHQFEDFQAIRDEFVPWADLVRKNPWTFSLLVGGAALAVGVILARDPKSSEPASVPAKAEA